MSSMTHGKLYRTAYGRAMTQTMHVTNYNAYLTKSCTYHYRQFLAAVSPVFQKSFYGSFGKLIIQQYFIIQ